MDIQSRKIAFIQDFLKVHSEDLISQLESILRKEKSNSEENSFEPMTKEELNKQIDQSEADFQNNRYKNSSELLAKYK